MQTLRLSVEKQGDAAIVSAAEILRAGGLVAFPTETVYGLGANACSEKAVRRIFEAKERPAWDPLIVHAFDLAMLRSLAAEWPSQAEALARAFMPGPLTLLLRKTAAIPAVCTAGREKAGLRIPANPIARRLIELAGVPVAAPSANRFGRISPTTAAHVLSDLDGRIDAVLDGGATDVGVESTVIDPTPPATIFRPGGISRERIESVLGPVREAQRALHDDASGGMESPGRSLRHYAPRARIVLVANEMELQSAARREAVCGRVGVLLPKGWKPPVAGLVIFEWGGIEDGEALAQSLYRGLRALDEQGVEVIVAPLPGPGGLGLAVRDRLRKAARE